MTPFECFKAYSALKLHFTSDYDYFLYNGKTKIKQESFEKRNDKLFFMKIAKHSDPINFLMINILNKPRAWIKDIAYSKESQSIYLDWLKRKESLSYLFKEDLKKLDLDFDKNLKGENNTHPLLIIKYLSGEILIETVCIICVLTDCMKKWNISMKDDPIWDEISRQIIKYTPFMKIDKNKYKKIILNSFELQN